MKRNSSADPLWRGPGPGEPSERTQSGKAYWAIRRKILRCELAPAELVNEKRLMRELGIGRTPVREALLRLAGERLILFQINHSIQVAPINLSDLRDLYETRLHSERLAARLCAQRMEPALAEQLAHCFDPLPGMLEEKRIEDVIHLDFLFHSLIYRGARNTFLAHQLHNLFGHSYRVWYLTRPDDIAVHAAIAQSHAPLVEALISGDADRADRETGRHIFEAYDRIVATLKSADFGALLGMDVRTFDC